MAVSEEKHRKFMLRALFTAPLLAAALSASVMPSCPESAALSTYLADGYQCAFGQTFAVEGQAVRFFVKDFQFGFEDVGEISTGFDPLTVADQIFVSAPSVLGKGFSFASPLFNISEGMKAIFRINYLIDPPPPIIPGFEDDLFTRTPVAPGSAVLTTDVCAGAAFDGDACAGEFATLEVFHVGGPIGNQLFDSVLFKQPTNIVGVRNTLTLDAGPVGGGGSSQIDGFGNTARSLIAPVPEPNFGLLAGVGLLLLAAVRARSKSF
jgi:hypothetical protein